MADLKPSSTHLPQLTRPLRVGLTGGIGSGKSAVAEELANCGAAIIDTDLIAHQLTGSNGLAMPAILQAFGSEFCLEDGSLHRAAMRELVFNDPKAKQMLEGIIHPLIYQEAQAQARLQANKHPAYLVFMIPLLAESSAWLQESPDRLDCVVVVDCPSEQQIARVQQRNGLSVEMVKKIISSQAPRHTRVAMADYVIENNAGLDELKVEVQRLHQILLRHKSS